MPSGSLAGARALGTSSLAEDVGDFHPTPAQIKSEITIVLESRLSPTLQEWVDRYAVVGSRNPYLWNWCRRGVEVTTLSCVDPHLRDALGDTKVLGVMLDVLIDDVADQGGNPEFLERLLELPYRTHEPDFSRFSLHQQEYAQFTIEVWDEIQRRISSCPQYDEYANLVHYDYQQLFNMMRYSQLLNENPYLLNLAEHDLYTPHNMHMMVSSTIDLMSSPTFDYKELGKVREAAWNAQCMGRIGNLTTTWQRELGEEDFTSGVFAHVVSQGKLTVDDLLETEPELIEPIIEQGGHEEFFLERWQTHRRALLSMEMCSVDLSELVAGLEHLICLHLGSRGDK